MYSVYMTELLLSGSWGSGEKLRVKSQEKKQNVAEKAIQIGTFGFTLIKATNEPFNPWSTLNALERHSLLNCTCINKSSKWLLYSFSLIRTYFFLEERFIFMISYFAFSKWRVGIVLFFFTHLIVVVYSLPHQFNCPTFLFYRYIYRNINLSFKIF